jgi:hypothetical protein
MDRRFTDLAAAAATSHGVFTSDTAEALGVSGRLRRDWTDEGRIERLGKRTFKFAGTPVTWKMQLVSALGDLGPLARVDGRSAGALLRLDGFNQGAVEIWVPREYRNRSTSAIVRSSSHPVVTADHITVDGIRCVTAERVILDSLLFRFTKAEIHNAIDSAVRMRLVSEHRLRKRIIEELPSNTRHRQLLIAALVDTGGESALERRFLALIRRAGLPRPTLRRVYRDGSRVIARVDAEFPSGLIVELDGHGTHATREQRSHDAQRRTELTLRGKLVITFTYDDVHGRPKWVIEVLRAARVADVA